MHHANGNHFFRVVAHTFLSHMNIRYAVQYCNSLFLNRQAAGRYQALASIIQGPRLIKKNYRAVVSQRLRTTAVTDYISCSPPNTQRVSPSVLRVEGWQWTDFM
jgi:hypothetical protein